MLNTWITLLSYIEAGRNKSYRTLSGVATEARITGGTGDARDVAVCYHGSPVVIHHSDGTATLNSCGWRTVTTKARINQYSKASVYQRRGQWYFQDGSRFYDGVQIDREGNPIVPM